MLHRYETIKWMNDRIRNALQAIECVTYAADATATEPVKSAVDVIEGILNEVLIDAHPRPFAGRIRRVEASRLMERDEAIPASKPPERA
jgi:hypothetical protein